MKFVMVLLGIVDIVAAALVFFPFSDAVMLYVMVFMLAKGGFFLCRGLASRSIGPHCIALCVSDILVGITLGVMALGFGMPGDAGTIPLFLKTAGLIGLAKGVYTTAFPLLA